MKQTAYTTTDGKKGFNYSLEASDVVQPLFGKVHSRPNTAFPGKFNYTLKAKTAKYGEVYVRLTEGQAKQLEKLGDLTGKSIVAYAYTAYNKDQVGVKVQ